jgi:hypothetical protein
MIRSRFITSLCLLSALLACPNVQAGHVLGPEAEGPVMGWLAKTGLALDAVDIARGVVTARAGTCTLLLTHPSATPCEGGRTSGNVRVCRDGARCPSDKVLEKAGSLTLPWRAAERDTSDTSDQARSAIRGAKVEAQRRFDIGQLERARDALLPLLELTGHHPMEILDALVALTGLGGNARVLTALESGALAELPVALRAALIVAAQLGPSLGADSLTATLTPEMACDATGFAAGLEVVHGHAAATRLTRTIRTLAPECFEAYALEAEMLSTLRRHDATNAVIREATSRFADHPGLARLEELALGSEGDEAGLIALYEKRLAAGDRSPGLFSVLFSHYVKHGVMKDRVARYMARAKADEGDDVGALVAGVLLHYEKQFTRSNVLVERAAPTFPEEPRVYIYQAMNHFNLGDREKAESFIAQAEALAAPDPDVYYCIGEIYRDSDRAKALEALEVYWHMTAVSGGDISDKQARVRGMMRAITACQRDATPAPCPGPFEHRFGSAAPAAAP